MDSTTWEMFDALYKTAHRQGRQIEELLTRVTELERRLRDSEADVQTDRPMLHVVEPCPLCSESLDGEQIVHTACAQLENALAERG